MSLNTGKTNFILIAAVIASGAPALAAQDRVGEAIRRDLSSLYPGARIECSDSIQWSGGGQPDRVDPSTLRVLGVNSQGFAQVSAGGAEGWVKYSAYVPAYVAVHRVQPGEKLTREMFVSRDVLVSSGQAYDYRGVILPASQGIDGLQSRQTVLEGQFLTSTAVERVPDVRRGDQIRLTVVSGGLSVSTQGQAQEPGFYHGRVRVTSQKTKREFVGVLQEDGSVEVKL